MLAGLLRGNAGEGSGRTARERTEDEGRWRREGCVLRGGDWEQARGGEGEVGGVIDGRVRATRNIF